MRAFVMSALALVVGLTAALAADDPMAATYGNTLVVVDPDGVESHLYYRADHSFSGRVPSANYDYKGTWSVDGTGHVCRTYSETIPGVPNPDCDEVAVVAHTVGDNWTAVTRGKNYKIALKAGKI